jgi:hypothetical protein
MGCTFLVRIIRLALCLLTAMLAANASAASPTAFTYQGKLNDGGSPANGSYDMRFNLYDTASVGTGTIYGTILRNGVAVTAGAFEVSIDFSTIFSVGELGTGTTPPLFLEVGVRPAGTANPFSILARWCLGVHRRRWCAGTVSVDRLQHRRDQLSCRSRWLRRPPPVLRCDW